MLPNYSIFHCYVSSFSWIRIANQQPRKMQRSAPSPAEVGACCCPCSLWWRTLWLRTPSPPGSPSCWSRQKLRAPRAKTWQNPRNLGTCGESKPFRRGYCGFYIKGLREIWYGLCSLDDRTVVLAHGWSTRLVLCSNWLITWVKNGMHLYIYIDRLLRNPLSIFSSLSSFERTCISTGLKLGNAAPQPEELQ